MQNNGRIYPIEVIFQRPTFSLSAVKQRFITFRECMTPVLFNLFRKRLPYPVLWAREPEHPEARYAVERASIPSTHTQKMGRTLWLEVDLFISIQDGTTWPHFPIPENLEVLERGHRASRYCLGRLFDSDPPLGLLESTSLVMIPSPPVLLPRLKVSHTSPRLDCNGSVRHRHRNPPPIL